jgi:hypothetical protein
MGGRGVNSKCLEAMPKPDKDDVERLSRGQATRAKIGSRRIGHRLTQKERLLFEAARRQGFLKIPVTGIRPNVVNIYRLWCAAEGKAFHIKGSPAGEASNSHRAGS